jgi:hypothetical protein
MISSPFRDGAVGRLVEQRSPAVEDRFDIRHATNQNRPEDE